MKQYWTRIRYLSRTSKGTFIIEKITMFVPNSRYNMCYLGTTFCCCVHKILVPLRGRLIEWKGDPVFEGSGCHIVQLRWMGRLLQFWITIRVILILKSYKQIDQTCKLVIFSFRYFKITKISICISLKIRFSNTLRRKEISHIKYLSLYKIITSVKLIRSHFIWLFNVNFKYSYFIDFLCCCIGESMIWSIHIILAHIQALR